MKHVDWAGTWFGFMERLGESTDMIFAKIDRYGKPSWRVLKHTERDGISAINLLLHGADADPARTRQSREKGPPGPCRLARAIYKHARTMRAPTRFRDYDPEAMGRSPAVAWVILDTASTQALKEAAASRRVSLNSLLLHSLERAVRDEQLIEGGASRWAILVNLRGATGLPDEVPNQFSSLNVACPAGATLAEIHAAVREKFNEGNHWANWSLMHVGKHIGLKRAEALLAKSYAHPKPGTGALSSLGEWASDDLAPEEAWIVLAPVSRLNPIASATLAVNGKLAVTLQMHPALKPSPERIRALMARWRTSLHEASGVSAPPWPVSLIPTQAIRAEQGASGLSRELCSGKSGKGVETRA